MSVFPITAGPGSTGQWPGATYDCEAGGGGPGAQVTRQPAAVTQHASVARTLCRWCCAYCHRGVVSTRDGAHDQVRMAGERGLPGQNLLNLSASVTADYEARQPSLAHAHAYIQMLSLSARGPFCRAHAHPRRTLQSGARALVRASA